MKVTHLTREVLANRRERRAMLAAGWEYVSDGGGRLWELHRGARMGHRITDVRIDRAGMGLWIKTAEDHTPFRGAMGGFSGRKPGQPPRETR